MNAQRIIAVDIGNSSTNIGLFQGSEILKHDFLPSAAEYSEKICQIVDEWRSEALIEHVIVASVVPALGDLLATLVGSRQGCRTMRVEDFKTTLLPLKVDHPETVGVDRITNCYAALHLLGAPVIVVSLGTATTFEVISPEGEYIGGAIAPGVKISLEALTQRTSLLPPAILTKPKRIVAKNTLEHMESGIYYGTVSLIEGMIQRIRADIGQEIPVVGTGGVSSVIAAEGIFDRHEPQLTLKGLELIHRNHCHPA